MKKEQMPRVSQCMIVKNEEENIRQALSWGREIMWEQIVVDTGSTDRTAELAKEMGAAVYHFSWIDDFAAAKNFACQQAKGDWIAFLDADEYMDAENVERLRLLLCQIAAQRLPYEVLVTNWFNLDDEGQVRTGGNQARFFRNHCGLQYKGRIHESLCSSRKILTPKEVLNACDQLTIYHTGYTKHALAAGQKQERNRRLILKELKERPNDYAMMANMADTYRSAGENEPAIEWYEKAVAALPPAGTEEGDLSSRLSDCFSSLLLLLVQERRERERILEVYEQAVRYVPEDSDFDYIVGSYLVGERQYEQAAAHLELALKKMDTYGNLCCGILLTANLLRAWEYLGTCYYNMGRRDLCVNCCVRLLQTQRYAMGVLKLLLLAFATDAQIAAAEGRAAANGSQVLGFLGKLYDLTALKDRLFVWKAAGETGYDELAVVLRGLFLPQEQALLDAAAGKDA